MSRFHLNRIKQDLNANKIGPKNANMQYFSGDIHTRIDTLVRETIQNPLDNPLYKNKPVKIVFKKRMMKVSEIPKNDEILETINALLKTLYSQRKSETGLIQNHINHFSKAKASIEEGEISVLQISDYNTTGLIGSRNDMNSNLGRFLGGDGVFDDESSGGGSGGLGKYAPFTVSNIGFCFYSSRNKNNEYIYYGWGKYFTHTIKKTEYTGEINIGGNNNDVLKRKSSLHEGFLSERKERGTDVFSLGFSVSDEETLNWETEVVKAVIRNFYGSILDKKLIVSIVNQDHESIEINTDTIINHLVYFDETNLKSKLKLLPEGLTVEAVNVYANGKKFKSKQLETPILGQCFIQIQQNDEFTRNFNFMRGPRMHIYNEKISAGDINFAGVFICNSEQGNKELRLLEDSHHKEWKFNMNSKGRQIKKEINQFIERCVKEVATFDNSDEFSISGTNLLSFGNSGKAKSNQPIKQLTKNSTAIIFPKNVKVLGISKSFFNGEVKVDKKGKKKKTKPKKPAYTKPNTPSYNTPSKKNIKERVYKVDDFKAIIFKNDAETNEYHLFIESKLKANIKTISFDIPMENGKLAELNFIDNILDDNNIMLERNIQKGSLANEFENFQLNQGSNKFIVKTRFNKKVQIIIK